MRDGIFAGSAFCGASNPKVGVAYPDQPWLLPESQAPSRFRVAYRSEGCAAPPAVDRRVCYRAVASDLVHTAYTLVHTGYTQALMSLLKNSIISMLKCCPGRVQSSLAAPLHPFEIVEVLDTQGFPSIVMSQNVSQNGWKMAGKVRHLKFRSGRYSARLVVPKHLRPIVGKAELETQLGSDRRQALASLPGAVAGLQAKIAVAERKANGGKPVPVRYPMSAEEIAIATYHSLIAFDLDIREQDPRFANLDVDDGLVADLRAGIGGRLDDDALAELVGYRIERFRHRGNTDAVKGTSEWRKLAMSLCVSEYEALARKVERDGGDFSGKPGHPVLANGQPAVSTHEPVLLTKLLDDYLAILERQGKGREARKRWTPVFDDLIAFVKHKDAAVLTKKNLADWRDKKLETLSAKTVADVHIASVRAVLGWAVENDRLPSNPADGVKVKKSKPIRSRERGFRDDEALAVLKACRAYTPSDASNPANREGAKITAAKRWASLLCAFTGARAAEITQLRKQDVRKEGNFYVLRITPDAGSVKAAHYRDVPIHDQLVDLGFVEFVNATPDGPLFHNAKAADAIKGARTTSGRVSVWLQRLGVIPEGVQPNHGWRHRFKTVGEELGVSSRVLDAIQGHAARTAGDGYGDITIAAKKYAIDQFPRYDIV